MSFLSRSSYPFVVSLVMYVFFFYYIHQAREKDATAGEKRLGLEMAQSLKSIIDPYFLRRTKAEVKEREKGKAGSKDHKCIV